MTNFHTFSKTLWNRRCTNEKKSDFRMTPHVEIWFSHDPPCGNPISIPKTRPIRKSYIFSYPKIGQLINLYYFCPVSFWPQKFIVVFQFLAYFLKSLTSNTTLGMKKVVNCWVCVFWCSYMTWQTYCARGQLISKVNFEVFIWTKKRTKIFPYFCLSFWNGSNHKNNGSLSC